MRVLLFYISIFIFVVGLMSMLFLNPTSPVWLWTGVIFCTVSGIVTAAFLSCVSPPPKREETVPLKTREIDSDVVEL